MAQAVARPWREAATLILTARQPTLEAATFDYRVLMLQRSSRSKFMPNAFVFPGGVVDQGDMAEAWLSLYRDLGQEDSLASLDIQDRPRPLVMVPREGEAVPRHLALRLTAIRETFEESGVLLLQGSPTLHPELLAEWRGRVQREPGLMVDLCREVGAVPDLWALREWSDWLTPTNLSEQGTRRFDTMFYTAQLPSLPSALQDQTEVTAVRWEEPASLLDQARQNQLWLAPPQVYEVSRLLHFTKQEELQQFARQREGEGLSTWLPVRLQCSDGLLSLYPGDSMYPDQPDFIGDPSVGELPSYPGTIAECRSSSPLLNRQEFPGGYSSSGEVVATCPPSHGHRNPLPAPAA